MQSFYHLHPRKLLKVTAGRSIPKSCQSPCDPHKNHLGSCPIACIGLCADVCKYSQPISLITRSSAPEVAHIGPSQHHHKSQSHHLSPYGIVFLALVIAACLALTVYATYKQLSKRRRRSSSSTERADDDQGEEQNPNHGDHELMISDEDEDDFGPVLDHPIWYIRTVGLLPSVIGSITVVRYKKGDGLVEGTGCSVCLTEFEEDESVKLLPKCSHAFHITCVDMWLRSHTNCPLCRAPVMNSTSQEITTTLQNASAVEDNGDDDGRVVGMELEKDDDDDDDDGDGDGDDDDDVGSESRTNRGFKIEEDCNIVLEKGVVNFDQSTVESL